MPLCIASLDRACAKPRQARRCLVRMLVQLRRVFGGGAMQLLYRVLVNVLRLLARPMNVLEPLLVSRSRAGRRLIGEFWWGTACSGANSERHPSQDGYFRPDFREIREFLGARG